MAAFRAYSNQSGRAVTIQDGNDLIVGSGVQRGIAGNLSVGTDANTNTLLLGRVGQLATVLGNQQVDGAATFNGNATFGNAVSDTISFVGVVGPAANPNLVFDGSVATHLITASAPAVGVSGSNLTIVTPDGGAATAGLAGGDGGGLGFTTGAGGPASAAHVAGPGGDLTVKLGDGGPATATQTAGRGGAVSYSGGDGGAANGAQAGGKGTSMDFIGGDGGAGSAGALSGAGGDLTFTAGAPGVTGGAGTGVSGKVTFNVGATPYLTLGATVGKIIVQAGVTLSTTGTGNISLPNNGTAIFQIEGVAVSANVTATNLTSLTGGASTALHTHTGVGSVPGTSGEALAAGEPASFDDVAGVPRVFRADANGAGELVNVVGINTAAVIGSGQAVVVQTSGEISIPDAIWDAVPATSDVGKQIFLSETVGKLTLTAPATVGSASTRVGWVTVGGAGAVKIAISIGKLDSPFDIAGYLPGLPGASAVVFAFIFTRAVTLPINLTGSFAKAFTASTGAKVYDIAKVGTGNIGTITFTASATGVLAMGAATAFAAGDVLTVTAPAVQDATLAGVYFTLAGGR